MDAYTWFRVGAGESGNVGVGGADFGRQRVSVDTGESGADGSGDGVQVSVGGIDDCDGGPPASQLCSRS